MQNQSGQDRGVWRATRAAWLALIAGCAVGVHSWAQPEGAPQPKADEPQGSDAAPAKAPEGPANVLDGPPTTLAFKNVTVDQIIPFLVEASGKVVVPQQDVLSRKVTVVNDRPIPRRDALHLVYLALQQNQIAVVEHADRITLRDIAEITKQDVPVIPPEESMLDRKDLGAIVEKVFTLKNVTSKKFGDAIKGVMPDYAKLTLDEESNQIAVLGSVALLQRVEKLVRALDRPPAGAIQTETFRLRYADSASIASNIQDLFSGSRRRQSGDQNQQRNRWQFGGQAGQEGAATSDEIRVTANSQQNAVTVAADPIVIEQIRTLIQDFWDQPLPDEAVVPKTYELKNSDPVKVRDLLEGLFGRGTPTRTATQPTTGPQGQGGQAQGGGGSSQPTQGIGRLAGQFSFQALPDSNRLVVVPKSPDNMAVIDKIIEDIDRPQTTGLPAIVELKHASAEDLAEQLNVLLAQDGTAGTLRRSESGLSESSSSVSPFATQTTQSTTDTGQTTTQTNTATDISFWWQRARAQADQRSASNLIGKIRIVPIWRQNALMVMAPPEYKNSVVELIQSLDRAGRQVLISAIVAEVSRDDATQLGLRWSSQPINLTNADNSISLGTSASGTENNFAGSLFDTSVLNANVNLNLVLQALAQKTRVNIMSEPKVFTGDNQEAEFFDGQDIPFVTDSQTNQQGNLVQSFDYRAVGIQLRVRPRITPKRDVDLRVNLELSSIVPGQTLFGGFVVDRRETTTQLIVRDGQTIVVSGILRQEDSDVVRKVPLLGDIPLFGELFKSREKSKSTTELLVFITPIVVENPDEAESLNAPYRERIRDRRERLERDVGGNSSPPAKEDAGGPG